MTTAPVQALDARPRSRTAPRRDRPLADSAVRAAWESAVVASEVEASHQADALHDGLMQSLVVIRHALAWERGNAGPSSAPAETATETATEIPDADDAVRTCLAQTRNLVWHLRPRVTSGSGLAVALEDLSARLAADGGSALQVEDTVEDLTAAQAIVIYRMVQERARAAAVGESLRVRVVREPGAVVVCLGGASYDLDSVWTERGAHLGVHLEGERG